MGTHFKGTAEERRALDTYIKLERASEAVSVNINQHLKDYGLTTSQFGVLEALFHLGPMQVGQLGEKILKSSGNMTLVVDNLVKRGLVERQRRDDDRRCIEVTLTETGRELIAAIWPSHLAGVVETFAALDSEEQDTLSRLCKKIGLSVQGKRDDLGDEVGSA